jgi:hypothetical protein
VCEIEDCVDRRRLQVAGVLGGEGNGHVLNPFFAPTSRDDDFFRRTYRPVLSRDDPRRSHDYGAERGNERAHLRQTGQARRTAHGKPAQARLLHPNAEESQKNSAATMALESYSSRILCRATLARMRSRIHL